jgi:hypothetical protein
VPFQPGQLRASIYIPDYGITIRTSREHPAAIRKDSSAKCTRPVTMQD